MAYIPISKRGNSKVKKTITYDEVEKLFFQAENFWVNNNFKSSPKEIINFLRNIKENKQHVCKS